MTTTYEASTDEQETRLLAVAQNAYEEYEMWSTRRRDLLEAMFEGHPLDDPDFEDFTNHEIHAYTKWKYAIAKLDAYSARA